MKRGRNHGFSGTIEHQTWRSMKDRCYNSNCAVYKYYGGRGIRVCACWRKSFLNFLEDMGPRPKGMTLERKNNDGHYEPSNCKWATRREQQRNSRQNHVLVFNGKKQCLATWAEEIGLSRQALRSRLISGWSVKRALTEKINMKYSHRRP